MNLKDKRVKIHIQIKLALEQPNVHDQIKSLTSILKSVRVENKASIQMLIDNLLDDMESSL